MSANTPRTDAARYITRTPVPTVNGDLYEFVSADFCRTLERELALHKISAETCATVARENTQLRAEVERLKRFEEMVASWVPTPDYSKRCADQEVLLHQLRARVESLEQDKARLVVARQVIKEYLLLGGLFDPEHMEHHKVRDLLMDIADIIDGKKLSPNGPIAPRIAAIDAARS